MMTLQQAQALLPGSTLVGDGAVRFERVHTDTRSLRPGDLFVALRGERFDGHDYLAQAAAAGAVAALAERGLGSLPGLQVADSLQGLQQLAAGWRRQMDLPLIAVTGSNGKTTVTQMIASILRAWLGDAALATAGNLNNHIGVPLTLLRLRCEGEHPHRAAVVELGMNHPGEIAQLAALAAPTVALINNAQREHQEFMSNVAAVARENGSVLEALPELGTTVLPADDVYLPLWLAMAGGRPLITFALDAAADVTGHTQWEGGCWQMSLQTPKGETETQLHVAGRHNVKNALAAAAAAIAAGAPLQAVSQGLGSFRPVAGRSNTLALPGGVTLVDDTYNANPDSVLAAIDVLADLPAPRWLVLGDMGEVGSRGPEFHAEVGEHARASGIETVWAVGALSAHAAAHRHFAEVPELIAALSQAPGAQSILVKGSRFMAMERVVAALQATQQAGAGHAA